MEASPIRAVVFDAVGTLITPQPDVVSVYFEMGRRHGSRRSPAAITGLFGRALAETTRGRSAAAEWCVTDESTEREFWRNVVGTVFGDLRGSAATACFEELFDHFSRPAAWRTYVDVAPVIARLRERGLTLAVASNFDTRLHRVFGGLPELQGIGRRFVSSEIGWRKPHERFFVAVCDGLGLHPQQVLYVGDEPESDVAAAVEAGLGAVLIRREGPCAPGVVTDLVEVADLIVPTTADDAT